MNNCLLVFSRYPSLGKVKSRLSPILSERERLALHRALVLDTLDRTALVPASRVVYLSGCSAAEAFEFLRQNGFGSVHFERQQGEDLGERMWKGWVRQSEQFRRIVILGADAPSVPLKFIRDAFDRLRDVPVVLGPACDGGYYLIGLTEPRRELFFGIDWGSSRVLEQTLSRLQEAEYELLPSWYDVDGPEDLRRLVRDLSKDFEGYPFRTGQVLDSMSSEILGWNPGESGKRW